MLLLSIASAQALQNSLRHTTTRADILFRRSLHKDNASAAHTAGKPHCEYSALYIMFFRHLYSRSWATLAVYISRLQCMPQGQQWHS